MLKIRYPYTISNEKLYERTNEDTWSSKIETRRLRWTGHLLRLPEQAPASLAYNESNRYTGKKLPGNRLTWKKQINKDLANRHEGLSLERGDIRYLAEDRDWWSRKIVKRSAVVSTTDGAQP